MLMIICAFISFPLLGYQFFGSIGAFIGLLLAIAYIPIEKHSKKSKEEQEKSYKKVEDKLISKVDGFNKTIESSTGKIKADTEIKKETKGYKTAKIFAIGSICFLLLVFILAKL